METSNYLLSKYTPCLGHTVGSFGTPHLDDSSSFYIIPGQEAHLLGKPPSDSCSSNNIKCIQAASTSRTVRMRIKSLGGLTHSLFGQADPALKLLIQEKFGGI